MIIRNDTGDEASIVSIGASAIAAGGTFDLDELDGGLPSVMSGDKTTDVSLYQAVAAGEWAVVQNGEALGAADGVLALTVATAAPQLPGTTQVVPVTKDTPWVVGEFDVDVGVHYGVQVTMHVTIGDVGSSTPGLSRTLFCAWRNTEGDVKVTQPVTQSSDAISGYNIKAKGNATSFEVSLTVRKTDDMHVFLAEVAFVSRGQIS